MTIDSSSVSIKDSIKLNQDEVFYFDTDLDTLITTADTDDNLEFHVDGGNVLSLEDAKIELNADSYILQDKKTYLDTDLDTWIGTGDADDVIEFYAGNNKRFEATNTGSQFYNTAAFNIITIADDSNLAETKKLTLDTDLDTYLFASADDVFRVYTGGGNRFSISNGGVYSHLSLILDETKNIYLDADTDTGFYCPSDDVLRVRTGATIRAEFNTTSIGFDLPVNLAPNASDTGVSIKANTESVDDEGTITLPDATTMWGEIQVGDDEEWATFGVKADGTVTLRSNSANVVNTDTDTKFCIYDSGTGATLKNRLGSTKNVRYVVHY